MWGKKWWGGGVRQEGWEKVLNKLNSRIALAKKYSDYETVPIIYLKR